MNEWREDAPADTEAILVSQVEKFLCTFQLFAEIWDRWSGPISGHNDSCILFRRRVRNRSKMCRSWGCQLLVLGVRDTLHTRAHVQVN